MGKTDRPTSNQVKQMNLLQQLLEKARMWKKKKDVAEKKKARGGGAMSGCC